jgi:hypothetical protein
VLAGKVDKGMGKWKGDKGLKRTEGCGRDGNQSREIRRRRWCELRKSCNNVV